MVQEEGLSSGLIKGSLLSKDIGGTAFIHDALYLGSPVVIKQARDEATIPLIQQEYAFLLDPPIKSVEAKFSDYGLPSDWTVQTRFVNLIPSAVTPSMFQKGIIVLEKLSGKSLIDKAGRSANLEIPPTLHFAAVMGWIDMLRRLNEHNISMDSNIDTDLLIVPDFSTKILNAVRIDCLPMISKTASESQSPLTAFWIHVNAGNQRSQNLTNEQNAVNQIIGVISMLYRPTQVEFSFLSPEIYALQQRFDEGMVSGAENLFGYLKRALAKLNWNLSEV
jgi:hypothetical protein